MTSLTDLCNDLGLLLESAPLLICLSPPPPLKGYATRSIQTFREHQGFDPWTVAIAYELLYIL